jgi:hypothetical protein
MDAHLTPHARRYKEHFCDDSHLAVLLQHRGSQNDTVSNVLAIYAVMFCIEISVVFDACVTWG